MFNIETEFGRVSDRWLPLIYKGAMQYAIPGRLDADDLVQEGLILLHETIVEMVSTKGQFEVDSFEFEKYFKTALYRRYIDKQRIHQSKKRSYHSEVHSTDDYNPLEYLQCRGDSPEEVAIVTQTVDRVKSRIPEKYHAVLEAWLNPSQEIIDITRRRTLRCINTECKVEYETSGIENSCPNCGSATEVVKSRPTRMLQSDVIQALGITRQVLTESMIAIRHALKNLNSPSLDSSIHPVLEILGYGRSGEFDLQKPIPQVASCRLSEGDPSYTPLTYSTLLLVLSDSEKKFVDFVVTHPSESYQMMKFTDMSRRSGINVHDLRRIVDSIRIKVEFIDCGAPLKDIPKEL